MSILARRTRGRGKPSLGLMARLGVPVGGRVRKLRAVEDHLARPQRDGRRAVVARYVRWEDRPDQS